MTTTRRYPITCECGHKGEVVWVEKANLRGDPREDYSLDGFDGERVTIASPRDFPEDIIAALNPKCPRCGETNKVSRV